MATQNDVVKDSQFKYLSTSAGKCYLGTNSTHNLETITMYIHHKWTKLAVMCQQHLQKVRSTSYIY